MINLLRKKNMLKIKNFLVTLKTIYQKFFKSFFQKICQIRFTFWLIWGFLVILLLFGVGFLLVKKNNPGELSLKRLENSWKKEKICHDECLVRRNKEKAVIIKSLTDDPKKINKKIKKYLFSVNNTISSEFQIELIKILASAYGYNNLPVYLRNALMDNQIASHLQIAILNNFQVFGSDSEARDFYLSILSNNREIVLKKEAVRFLSNLNGQTEEGKELMAITDFEPLKNLLFASNTPSSLRISLIMLLSDYYYLFPKQSVEILTDIYQTLEFDNFSRALAADALNHFNPAMSYALPIISENDWQQYYNN